MISVLIQCSSLQLHIQTLSAIFLSFCLSCFRNIARKRPDNHTRRRVHKMLNARDETVTRTQRIWNSTIFKLFDHSCHQFDQKHISNEELSVPLSSSTPSARGTSFDPQFWNENGWYGMLGIIGIVCIKKRLLRCVVLAQVNIV